MSVFDQYKFRALRDANALVSAAAAVKGAYLESIISVIRIQLQLSASSELTLEANK